MLDARYSIIDIRNLVKVFEINDRKSEFQNILILFIMLSCQKVFPLVSFNTIS